MTRGTASCIKARRGKGASNQRRSCDGLQNRHGGHRRHFRYPGHGHCRGFQRVPSARGALRACPKLGQHRQRQPARPGRDRVRLHGIQLGSPGGSGDGALRPSHRSAHGFARQRRPDLFRRSCGCSRGERRRSRRQAGGCGRQGQRDDPARPHPLRRAGHSLLGLHPRVHGLPRGSGRAGGGGGGHPVPVPDPQCRDDRPERTGSGQGGPVPRGADRARVVAGSLLPARDHAPGRLPGRRRRHSPDSPC